MAMSTLAGAVIQIVVAGSLMVSALPPPNIEIKAAMQAWDPTVQAQQVALMSQGQNPRVRPPMKTKNVDPQYPKDALKAGIAGKVRLVARVDVKGRVVEFTTAEGEPLLVEAARSAVQKWRYIPLRIDNMPIETKLEVNLIFRARESGATSAAGP